MAINVKAPTPKAGCLPEILLYLIAVLLLVGTIFLGYMNEHRAILITGTILSLVYSVGIFAVPYLRRNAYLFFLAILLGINAIFWIIF